jgi:hypothetical protein
MCLGAWSKLGFVRDIDVKTVVSLPEIPADEKEDDLPQDWDSIKDSEIDSS